MSESKFTKGKWKIVPSLSNPAYNVVGSELGCKFKIARCPYFINQHSEELTFRDEQEAKYNALLISKAPELLKAVSELIKELEFHGYNHSTTINNSLELIKEATEL